jgi:hypothetical protein
VEEFRDQLIEELMRRMPSARVETPAADQLTVYWEGQPHPLTFSLGEDFQVAARYPRSARMIISRRADQLQISSVVPRRETLVILIHPADYNPDVDPERPHLTRPVADGLVGVVVNDNSYGYQYISVGDFNEVLGLDEAGLWAQAMQNTRERLELEDVPLRTGEAWKLFRGDGLAASLLLIDEVWDPPRQPPLVAVAPVAPNKLLVAPADDPISLTYMREAMQLDPLSADWRRFRDLLVRRDGRWEVLR